MGWGWGGEGWEVVVMVDVGFFFSNGLARHRGELCDLVLTPHRGARCANRAPPRRVVRHATQAARSVYPVGTSEASGTPHVSMISRRGLSPWLWWVGCLELPVPM